MKTFKIFTLAVVTALSFSFASCSDDDDDNEGNNNEQLYLPTSIVYTDADEVGTYTFVYDEKDTTRIVRYIHTLKKIGSTNTPPSVTSDLTYNESGQLVAIKEVNTLWEEETNYTYTYKTESSTGNTVISKNEDGLVKSIITTDNKGRVLLWDEDALYENSYILHYTYSGDGIKTATIKTKDGSRIMGEASPSYNSENGIFKNTSTPQWALLCEFDFSDLEGHFAKALTEVDSKYYSFDQAGELENTEEIKTIYRYDSFIERYPVKMSIEVVEEDYSYTKSYEIKYNKAK